MKQQIDLQAVEAGEGRSGLQALSCFIPASPPPAGKHQTGSQRCCLLDCWLRHWVILDGLNQDCIAKRVLSEDRKVIQAGGAV